MAKKLTRAERSAANKAAWAAKSAAAKKSSWAARPDAPKAVLLNKPRGGSGKRGGVTQTDKRADWFRRSQLLQDEVRAELKTARGDDACEVVESSYESVGDVLGMLPPGAKPGDKLAPHEEAVREDARSLLRLMAKKCSYFEYP